jgi:glycosyltransferase involved in cell wall biosynthesis
MLQYIPFLTQQGLEVTVRPLLNNNYLEVLYQRGKRLPGTVAAAYARRLITLLTCRDNDLVWIEKELLPWFPASLEHLLLGHRVPYVVDYDDATFHNYDRHPNPLVRRLFGRKIDRIMSHAAWVVAGNEYLAERARCAGARRVTVLPTVIDLDRYPNPTSVRPPRPFTIGWMGSPSTRRYLEAIRPALARMSSLHAAKVVLIGSGAVRWEDVDVEVRPWSETSEVADLRSCDVGIMPLDDTPWERGKCGYKLIQYMACGLPVVASPVGANCSIVRDGETGYLADTPEAWYRALDRLGMDSLLRQQMGAAGRLRVETSCCLQKTGPLLLDGFHQIIAPRGG